MVKTQQWMYIDISYGVYSSNKNCILRGSLFVVYNILLIIANSKMNFILRMIIEFQNLRLQENLS